MHHLRLESLLLLTTSAVLALGAPQAASAGPGSLQQKEAVKNLMLCYAAGTDAIGDSTRADPAGDGLAIYERCFTEDAVFQVWFPGTPFDGPPSIPAVVGPAAWADFVFGAFDGSYTFTQHMVSNFMVKLRGRHARLTAYLNASHVTQEDGAVTQVDVANGTYTLKIKKIRGRYRITELKLTLLNFNPFFP